MSDQIPFAIDSPGTDTPSFGTQEFALNPEPRVPCVLVLDTSGSMAGEPIRQLNEGLRLYRSELLADPLASKRVEVAIVTFGPVTVVQNFATSSAFEPPTLVADDVTPLGAAVEKALDMVQSRKQEYRENGIAYYRPWVFLITDGAPTDRWEHAASRARQEEDRNGLAFFAVGVEGADFSVLRQFTNREPLKLKGLQFRDLFQWLSASQQSVSRSQPDEKVALPAPTGWAEV